MCQEIAQAYGGGVVESSGDCPELVRLFRQQLERASARRPLNVFVDSLDQLWQAGQSESLLWMPDRLPPHARLIVSSVSGPAVEALLNRIPDGASVKLERMPAPDGARLLRLWLSHVQRTLQPSQRRVVITHFTRTGNPLYLSLAFEQARRWRPEEHPKLAASVPRSIDGLLRQNACRARHGAVLVGRSLGYLVAARNGLTETEILEVLSNDREVLHDFRRRSPDSPRSGQLPDIVWSRLVFDLEPYLTRRHSDGAALLGFYHRQFQDRVARRYGAGVEGERSHRKLAAYFCARPTLVSSKSGPSIPNRRKLSELPYQLAGSRSWTRLRDLGSILSSWTPRCGNSVHRLASRIMISSRPPENQALDGLRLKCFPPFNARSASEHTSCSSGRGSCPVSLWRV